MTLFDMVLPPSTSLLLSSLRSTSRLQNLKRTHQCIIHSHHGSGVIKFSTIVGCREYCHQFTICKELISILNNLVRSNYQVQIMTIEEFMYNIYSKSK